MTMMKGAYVKTKLFDGDVVTYISHHANCLISQYIFNKSQDKVIYCIFTPAENNSGAFSCTEIFEKNLVSGKRKLRSIHHDAKCIFAFECNDKCYFLIAYSRKPEKQIRCGTEYKMIYSEKETHELVCIVPDERGCIVLDTPVLENVSFDEGKNIFFGFEGEQYIEIPLMTNKDLAEQKKYESEMQAFFIAEAIKNGATWEDIKLAETEMDAEAECWEDEDD